jgi:hypothetical protein
MGNGGTSALERSAVICDSHATAPSVWGEFEVAGK